MFYIILGIPWSAKKKESRLCSQVGILVIALSLTAAKLHITFLFWETLPIIVFLLKIKAMRLICDSHLGQLVAIAHDEHTATFINDSLVSLSIGELEGVGCIVFEVELSHHLVLSIVTPVRCSDAQSMVAIRHVDYLVVETNL